MEDWRLKTGSKPPLDTHAEEEFRLELEKEVIQVGGFKLDRFIKMMNMYVRMTLAQSTVHDCNDVLVLTTWVNNAEEMQYMEITTALLHLSSLK
jgi:hypothetical protein